jgi:hypothetical protein
LLSISAAAVGCIEMGDNMDGLNDIDDQTGFEKYSRRYKNRVDMVEREMITGRETSNKGDENDSSPRVVISEAPAKSHVFIAKSRSQLKDVDNLLRSIMNRPLN